MVSIWKHSCRSNVSISLYWGIYCDAWLILSAKSDTVGTVYSRLNVVQHHQILLAGRLEETHSSYELYTWVISYLAALWFGTCYFCYIYHSNIIHSPFNRTHTQKKENKREKKETEQIWSVMIYFYLFILQVAKNSNKICFAPNILSFICHLLGLYSKYPAIETKLNICQTVYKPNE